MARATERKSRDGGLNDPMIPENAGLRAELEARLRFETLVAELSSKFINIPSSELDREIEDAQRRVCECLGLDLSALWQSSVETPQFLTLTHLYRPLGGPPLPEPMDGSEYFPWCQQQLAAGKLVVVSSLEDLPPEADRDKETWRHFGIKTSLTIPLSTGGGPTTGALSFNTTAEERTWPEAIVRRLQLVAQIFTNALARRRSEVSLRESEERLDLAADSAGVGLWGLGLASGIFWLTQRARELYGFDPDEVVTLDRFLSAVHPEDRDLIRETVQKVAHSENKFRVDYRIVRRDGSVGWVSSRGRARYHASGKPDRLMGVSLDITERKQAEEAARELSGRLIHAHEEERTRLARELHDDVTQRLARLAIDAGRAEFLVSAPTVSDTMRELREGLVRLSADVHALSYRLHPSLLEDLGMAEALKTECERVSRQESFSVTTKLGEVPESIPHDVALCLFRVAQEAVRNVARHAHARTVEVTVREIDGGLQLAVRDDGAGFDPALYCARRTLGLTSMRERVHLLHGELDIESAPGRGTTVVAWVPLKEA